MLKFLITLLLPIVSSDKGYFLQISDVHYDEFYRTGSPATCYGEKIGFGCCRTYDISKYPYRIAGEFGDANCDVSELLIEETFKYFNKTNLKLDYIIWTGDSAGHHIPTQTMKQNMDAVQKVTDLLNKYFPTTQIFPSIGNHDTYPIDQLSPPFGTENNTIVSSAISKMWSPWLDEEANKTLSYGGYYTIKATETLRIISLNTLYYDRFNIIELFADDPDPAGQWSWLKNTLYMARKNKEKVWLIGHIYPGSGEATYNYTCSLQSLVSEYSDIIVSNFWGHSHKDQLILYKNAAGNVVNHGYVIPSIIPNYWYSSARVYEYDKENYNILNYYQYNLNVSDQQVTYDLYYDLYYDAQNNYGLVDLSTKNWEDFAQQLPYNSILLERYYTNYYSSNPPNMNNQTDVIDKIYIEC